MTNTQPNSIKKTTLYLKLLFNTEGKQHLYLAYAHIFRAELVWLSIHKINLNKLSSQQRNVCRFVQVKLFLIIFNTLMKNLRNYPFYPLNRNWKHWLSSKKTLQALSPIPRKLWQYNFEVPRKTYEILLFSNIFKRSLSPCFNVKTKLSSLSIRNLQCSFE